MSADLAIVQITSLPPPEMISTLPLRLSHSPLQCGENVLAIGFSELTTRAVEDINYFISEGMYGAYGQIIELYPEGTNKMSPTPVIEVQGNWPGGMSGGPVFNQVGEVIGIVSRSVAPDGEDLGHGFAACFQLMPWLRKFLLTVDPSNPCLRKGWAVIRSKPWHLAGFFPTQEQALAHAKTLEPDYQVIFGSNRIGTDNFVSHKTELMPLNHIKD
jgi:serine protease Do